MARQALLLTSATALLIGIAAGSLAQQAPAGPQLYFVGNRLGLPINPAPDGAFKSMSNNVKVYGAIYSAEPGLHVLRLGRQSARDPDERQQRDGLHPAEIV
jgi:hypothetical protein